MNKLTVLVSVLLLNLVSLSTFCISTCGAQNAFPNYVPVPSGTSPQNPLPAGNYQKTISFENKDRTFFIHVPQNSGGPMPMLLLFHGGGGTALGIAAATHMNRTSDANAFISVYPQGYDDHWNDGRVVLGPNGEISRPNQNDVGFVDRVLSFMETRTAIDQNRVYTVGYSNGGLFNTRLTFEIPGQLAAAGMVCAPETTKLIEMFGTSHPELPVIFMLGTKDLIMPSAGGPISLPGANGSVLSSDETINKWVVADHCYKPPAISHLPNINQHDGSYVECAFYSAPHNNDVAFYRIIGGGHTWPGGTVSSPRINLGDTNQDIDASQLIWDFCSRHRKRI